MVQQKCSQAKYRQKLVLDYQSNKGLAVLAVIKGNRVRETDKNTSTGVQINNLELPPHGRMLLFTNQVPISIHVYIVIYYT